MARHYGLDWLRIGAFALLVVYHIGLLISPWDWHVNSDTPAPSIVYLLMALNPWRMLLLFLVSGCATRALLARSDRPGAFARTRTMRLLPPLLFGAAFLVTPQPWIEVTHKIGYHHSYGYFLLHTYFDFNPADQINTPALFHLWFLAYIWVYSMVMAAIAWAVPAGAGQRLQAIYNRLFGGWRLILLPIAWLMLVRLVLLPGWMPTNRVVDDLAGHLAYLPVFLFGFGLMGSARAWAAIGRCWPVALLLAPIGYAAILWDYGGYAGAAADFIGRPHIGRAGVVVMGWSMLVLLLGIADRWLNRDHHWRAPLAEAVLPVYLIHQTLIVVVGSWIVPLHMGPWVEFWALLAATVAGCWAFYAIGRRIGPLRPLIGLSWRRRVTAEG